jgi:two-component system response regulator PrrA
MPPTRLTVVVVEDDEMMMSAIESVLDARGYLALSYGTAEAALDSNELGQARCAILDVSLPGMSGIELCERMGVTPDNAGTPIILITARDERHVRDAAKACGVYAYLVKPFSGHELGALVDAVPAQRRAPATRPKPSNNAH